MVDPKSPPSCQKQNCKTEEQGDDGAKDSFVVKAEQGLDRARAL
jgi:hypothetical protein